MSIISKETWDKFTQEEKERVQKLYEHYKDDAMLYRDEPHRLVKANLESIFPEEALQPAPLTYEDVARELFKDKTTFYLNDMGGIQKIRCGRMYDNYKVPVNCTLRKQAKKLLAINKLLNVAKFLNGDWKPDWEGYAEKKYYISLKSKKISVEYTIDYNNSPVYFRTEELARQAIKILGEETVRLALGEY